MKGFVPYVLAGILIIPGLVCLRTVFKQRGEYKKLIEKEMPLTGKGSKLHLAYLGFFLIGAGVYILLLDII